MSINIVKDQIRKFIRDDNASVMAIKGDWGVGKTYCWNDLLQVEQNDNNVGLQKYSYVSLFGIHSLDSLKYEIFQSFVGATQSQNNFDKIKRQTTKILRKNLDSISKIFSGYTSLPIESIAFSTIDKTLICIDDLERRGQDLSLKDVLGLVSVLKEQKNCKVILLLNDGEQGLDDYFKYAEKVVDLELMFSPTPTECATIAFGETTNANACLKNAVIELKIKNIRVLKKIEYFVNKALDILKDIEGVDDQLVCNIIRTIVLFSWSNSCSSSNPDIPNYSFILKKTHLQHESQASSIKERDWINLLNSYGYRQTRDLELVFAKAVKDGYFTQDLLEAAIRLKISNPIESQFEAAYYDAWDSYKYSFTISEEEIIQAFRQIITTYPQQLLLGQLNSVVYFLRDLNKNDIASEFIDLYISLNVEAGNHEALNYETTESYLFFKTIDSEIKSKCENIRSGFELDSETLETIFNKLASNETLSQIELAMLRKVSKEEFYTKFKSLSGKNLYKLIEQSLLQEEAIRLRVVEALKQIGEESAINHMRISKLYNID